LYDLLIIGAGPAGLFCGIHCAAAGLSVCLLEKNTSAGKKLLISGSGRCNITNSAALDKFLESYGAATRFVKPALYNFQNQDLIRFFTERGVPLTEMNDGKVFPKSQKARDILNTLISEASGIAIHYNRQINVLQHENGLFHIACGTNEYAAKNLLIATGGLSYPVTGATGDGLRFAKALGHSVTETAPALTPLLIKDYPLANCAGISLKDAVIKIIRNNKIIRTSQGDVLFTHKGLSGPGILDISRYVQKQDQIGLQLSQIASISEIEKGLIAFAANYGNKMVKSYITTLGIPDRLAGAVMQSSGVAVTEILSRLERESRQKLSANIVAFPFTVAEVGGYDEAMVTRGGVSLAEVNPKTMESRLVPGLYFAGEVLDVDGDTGGFNIQFAFSSGKLAADSISAH